MADANGTRFTNDAPGTECSWRWKACRPSKLAAVDFRVFVEPQQGATYADQLAVAKAAEALGYSAFFRSDHYVAMSGDGLPGPTDSWVTLGGIARETDIDPARHDGHLGDLPLSRAAGDLGGPGRRDERRPCRIGHRRGLVRGRAPGVRHPVPAAGRTVRAAARATRHHHRAVDHARRRDVRLRRHALHGRRLARAAQAGSAAASADRHRRRTAPSGRRRSRRSSPPSSTCRSSGGRRQGAVRPGAARHSPTPAGPPTR